MDGDRFGMTFRKALRTETLPVTAGFYRELLGVQTLTEEYRILQFRFRDDWLDLYVPINMPKDVERFINHMASAMALEAADIFVSQVEMTEEGRQLFKSILETHCEKTLGFKP
jgi:hypothetical protein